MKPKKITKTQLSFFSRFEDFLNRKHPLFLLADKVDWKLFEQSFEPKYSINKGRPGKPIRLMVGLLILKHIRNLSDESVVEQWQENNYYQYFCGFSEFVSSPPCEASELVHFRHRIGESGIELILKESIRISQEEKRENNKGGKGGIHVSVDTTVQEKNITFPTDSKLHRKIIKKCQKIADEEGIKQRQSYSRILKKLGVEQRFRNHPKNKSRALKADKKVKTIAGRMVRELERHLPANSSYQNELTLFKTVLLQTQQSKNKIYSLNEPEVCCIAKGKEHKNMNLGIKYRS